MPLFNKIRNILGFKSLIWDDDRKTFKSGFGVSNDAFIWTPEGIRAAEHCYYNSAHEVPEFDCSCGLYAAFQYNIARDYRFQTVCAMFVVEASGKTVIHGHDSRPYGFRSKEQTIIAALKPDGEMPNYLLSSFQAAEYYGIEIIPAEIAIIAVDIWNTRCMQDYLPFHWDLARLSREEVLAIEL